MTETTALGAAMAAGNAEGVGVWNLDSLDQSAITSDVFNPSISEGGTQIISNVAMQRHQLRDGFFSDRDSRYARWKDAVKRTLGWESIVDDGSVDPGNSELI